MQAVFTNPNLFIVENARNLLEQADIPCDLKNRFLVSGFGEVSGIDSWPELWVLNDGDEPRARELLEAAGIGKADAQSGPDWVCPRCGERNSAGFSLCWQCQTPCPDAAPEA